MCSNKNAWVYITYSSKSNQLQPVQAIFMTAIYARVHTRSIKNGGMVYWDIVHAHENSWFKQVAFDWCSCSCWIEKARLVPHNFTGYILMPWGGPYTVVSVYKLSLSLSRCWQDDGRLNMTKMYRSRCAVGMMNKKKKIIWNRFWNVGWKWHKKTWQVHTQSDKL